MLYTVQVVGETTVLSSCSSALSIPCSGMEVAGTGEGGISLSEEEVSKYLRPSFAETYFSSQGLTLESRVQICDSSHKHFTSRMLLMGLSRARSADLVQVCD